MRPSFAVAILLPLVAAGSAGVTRDGSPPRRCHPRGENPRQVHGFIGRPFAVHVTSTGAVLVTEQDINVMMRIDSAMPRARFEVGNDPGDVVATRDGATAYVSGFNDGTITIAQLAGDTISTIVRLPTQNAYRLALSPNETRLYVTSTDGRLYVFDTDNQRLSTSKSLGGALQGIVLDHAGAHLYVTSTAGNLWRLDRRTLAIANQVHLDCFAQDVALSADDQELYVACEKGDALVLDSRTLALLGEMPTGPSFGLAVTPDDEQLYFASSGSGDVTVIDRAKRTLVSRLHVGGAPRRIAFSTSGAHAYVTNEWNWLTVID